MDRIVARLDTLPGNVQGAVWILMSAVIFTATNALIKHMGSTLDSFQMVFFRGLFGTLFLIPVSPLLIFGLGPLPRLGIAGGSAARFQSIIE